MLYIKRSENGSVVYKYEQKNKTTKPDYDPILVPLISNERQKLNHTLCEAIVDDLAQAALSFESGKYKITWDIPKLKEKLRAWVKRSS